MTKQLLEITVNGINHELAVKANKSLAEVLREDLNLTGTKIGCGQGDCGACTVLLNGRPINSCLTLALKAHKHEVVTIEGIATNNKLHPIQKAFIEEGAVQCGFCTPGMILSAKAFLVNNPAPTEKEIRHNIAGNLCRCTGYVKIIKAIKNAAEKINTNKKG